MFSCCSGLCFARESQVDARTQETFSHNVEILRCTRVVFTPDTPMKQPLAPIDLFPFCFRHYMSWPLFFNYDIDFQRLVNALYTVSQKYLMLCGRLSTDSQGRYAIEVGSRKEEKYDFPVIEMKAEMLMAEAVLGHGQMTTNSADFPVNPDKFPFFMQPLDINAIHKGQDPFLSVKLTHFSDGCCFAICICHFLLDGGRFSELYRDISRAYCGKEVPIRDVNRQCMMLEEFAKHFNPEDKEGCVIPATTPTGREPFNFKQYPGESSSLEMLYLSKELINDMKSRVAPFIPTGSFVSTADLMNGLLWMLDCEMVAETGDIKDSKDLGIAGTSSIYVAELCCNGHGVIPKNYLGNGTIGPSTFAEKDVKSKPLLELLASLALLTREKQVETKKEPKQVLKVLAGMYSPSTSAPKNLRSSVSNFCKFDILNTDFGAGPSALFLCHSGLPLTGALWFISPVFHDGGVLLTQTLTTRQKERLKKSSVLEECASGVRFLFDDFNTTELSGLMKQKWCFSVT